VQLAAVVELSTDSHVCHAALPTFLQCNKCTGACGASGPLPSACAGVNALKSVVEQCLSEYQTARKQGEKALQEAMKKYPSTC
jgi:hypothetical protein